VLKTRKGLIRKKKSGKDPLIQKGKKKGVCEERKDKDHELKGSERARKVLPQKEKGVEKEKGSGGPKKGNMRRNGEGKKRR